MNYILAMITNNRVSNESVLRTKCMLSGNVMSSVYNMDLKEAAQCARLVGARHDIPYHVIPASGDKFFDRERAGQFDSPNLLVVEPGEEILLQNSEA